MNIECRKKITNNMFKQAYRKEKIDKPRKIDREMNK